MKQRSHRQPQIVKTPPIQWVLSILFLFFTFSTIDQTHSLALAPQVQVPSAHFGSLRSIGAYPFTSNAEQAILLSGERVLVVSDLGHFFLWDKRDKGWQDLQTVPRCLSLRRSFTLTKLSNGDILVAGGMCVSYNQQTNSENAPLTMHQQLSILDSKTLQWKNGPILNEGRMEHAASLLSSGTLMLTGGFRYVGGSENRQEIFASVELLSDQKLTVAPDLLQARARHTATALANDKLLVVGGIDAKGIATNSVELWDPKRQQWRRTAPLKTARYFHSAVLLKDGRVQVSGGFDSSGSPLSSTEIWDPQSLEWSSGSPLPYPLVHHTSEVLNDSSVLTMGGLTLRGDPNRYAFHQKQPGSEWAIAGSINVNSPDKTAYRVSILALGDGSALALGPSRLLQWKTVDHNRFSRAPIKRKMFAHSELKDGQILISGGMIDELMNSSSILDIAEIFNPHTGQFSLTGRMHHTRVMHQQIPLKDGRVLAAGGWVWDRNKFGTPIENRPEIWDPQTGEWTELAGLQFAAHEAVSFNQLADGKVLFIASDEDEIVIASGPRPYRAWLFDPSTNQVQEKTVPIAAHSQAALAVLTDGRVLRFGGYTRSPPAVRTCRRENSNSTDSMSNDCDETKNEWVETFDPSLEIWNSRDGSSHRSAVPFKGSNRDWRTLVEKNGNVLFVEYRSASISQVPKQAEIWRYNTTSNKLEGLPGLLDTDSWPIVEGRNGILFAPEHKLNPGDLSWSKLPTAVQSDPNIFVKTDGSIASFSLQAPFAAQLDIEAGNWYLPVFPQTSPRWLSKPETLIISASKALVIGQLETGANPKPSALFWDRQQQSWSSAGALKAGIREYGDAILLKSGKVIYVGLIQEKGIHFDTNGKRRSVSRIACDYWDPTTLTWSDCNRDQNLEITTRRPTIGLQEDGTATLVTNFDQVYLFNENSKSWTPKKAIWNTSHLTYGAPVIVDEPMQKYFDEEQNKWRDISMIGARFWERSFHFIGRPYEVEFSDGPSLVPDDVPKSPEFLWDPKRKHWAYIFHPQGNRMGSQAKFLPDGCALSISPFSIFNPETGRSNRLSFAALGLAQRDLSFGVFPSSEIIINGVTDDTTEIEYLPFQRKASCQGIENIPDDDIMMPNMRYVARANTPTISWEQKLESQYVTALQILSKYVWFELALVGFVALLLTLRRNPLWRRKLHSFATTKLIKSKVKTSRGMRMHDWFSRLILLTFLIVLAVPFVKQKIQLDNRQRAEECQFDTSKCIDSKTGLLPRVEDPKKMHEDVGENPHIPCQLLGLWASRNNDNLSYRIRLKDDGTYDMMQHELNSKGYTGRWMVQGTHIVWLHDNISSNGVDVNRIQDLTTERFYLIEENQTKTKFDLIEKAVSKNCKPN